MKKTAESDQIQLLNLEQLYYLGNQAVESDKINFLYLENQAAYFDQI